MSAVPSALPEPAAPVAPPAPAPAVRPAHLHAIDPMRVLTVMGVVAVHVVSSTTKQTSIAWGAATILLHVNREVFFVLTALVLTHSYASRPLELRRFYPRRYWLVATPYVLWTLVYFAADGLVPPSRSAVPPALHTLAEDLVTGNARYHLYFLLVTMQIYLLFPLLLRLLQAARSHHVSLLVASLAVQLVFAAAVHTGIQVPGLLGAWLANPDAQIASYQFFILLGAIAALHLRDIAAWVRAHRRAVLLAVGAGVALGLASYAVDVGLLGLPPSRASEVFQPAVTLESIAAVLGLFAVGVRWAAWERPRWLDRAIADAAESSFGVYLAHPLLLQGLLAAAGAVGLLAAVLDAPGLAGVAVGLAVVPPLAIATWGAAWMMRRTPLSVPLTGRRRHTAARPGAAGRAAATAPAIQS